MEGLAWPENDFADWIGFTETASEVLTSSLVERFLAVVPGQSQEPELPLGLHWCLAPIAEPAEGLGPDGHPRVGLHLPPIPLPRRMWAGGRLVFHDGLRIGDEVRRVSSVESITRKTGRTGQLVFVTVQHEIHTGRGLAIDEFQDLVYREPPDRERQKPAEAATTPAAGEARQRIVTDPVLLFRYSAITFNGHRIHYDHPYATQVEDYPGLVVHGPLMATLLANLARRELGSLSRFSFRGQSPLICGETLELHAAPGENGLALEARSGTDGRIVMTAEAA